MVCVPIPLPDRKRFSGADMIGRAKDFYEEIRRRHTVWDYQWLDRTR